MTPSCPSRDEWVRHLDGEVTANRAAELAAHATACSACRTESGALDDLARHLRAPSVPAARVAALNARGMTALDAPAAPARRSQRWAWLTGGGLALAAAAALALVVTRPSSTVPPAGYGELQPRGNGELGLDRVAVTIHALDGEHASGGIRPLAAGTTVAANAAYVASYRNPGAPAFAMVFAIDAARELHWLYPAYTDAASNPEAARIATRSDPTLFEETVVLDAPAHGTMTFVILVGDQPLHVRDLEQLPHAERTVDALRARWPTASVRTISVDVR